MNDLIYKSISGTHLTPFEVEEIMHLDRINMTRILEGAGIAFPEERRRTGLADDSLRIILALSSDHQLIGYVDYRRDVKNLKNLYLSSIQIQNRYRGKAVFRNLVTRLIAELQTADFNELASHVQKSNTKMINIFRRLGFRIIESESGTWEVFGQKELLWNPLNKKRFKS